MKLSILRAGFRTTVQDKGRTGFRSCGVSLGGALDPFALRVANLLVGNEEDAACLEIALGNFRARLAEDRLVAWCGGEFDVKVGSTNLPPGRLAIVPAGEEIIISQGETGCRAWLAISGGIDAPRILNSRSTDLRANFGGFEGSALKDGDEISLGENSADAKSWIADLAPTRTADWSAPANWCSTAQREPMLRMVRGAHLDLLGDDARETFLRNDFTVQSDSDRMGVRLNGAEMQPSKNLDLVSEAVAPGTIQLPPSGRPILLLGDCQTIGGYPKIAHVITVDLGIAAQLRPGDRVRFREVSLPVAHRLLAQRERELDQFRAGIKMKRK